MSFSGELGYYSPIGKKIAYPVRVINKGDFIRVEFISGGKRGQQVSIIHMEYSTYVPMSRKLSVSRV
jgi:hypothetical protein